MRKFTIAQEGLWLGGGLFIVGLLFLLIGLTLLGILFLLAGIFILFFSRQPYRISIPREDVIYAPADGKIIQIREEYENGFFKQVVHKVSIFMSLFNVHITYAPINGEIDYLRYKPGRFTRADRVGDGSEEEVNENNFIGIRNGNGQIAIRQVAGWVARRIVCDKRISDKLVAGERVGMIKFGSRIDVYLPRDWQICVRIGERTKGGRTVLARRNTEGGLTE